MTLLTSRRGELRPVILIRDGEWLARSLDHARHPLFSWIAGQRQCGWLLESQLPEIRLLATLLAARRHQPSPTPSRLSDEADWLAARIYLLRLEQVEMADTENGTLAQANARLRELCGPSAPLAAAIAPASAQPAWLQTGWAPILQPVRDVGGAAAMAANSRRMRPQCQSRLASLISSLRSGIQAR
ncbi:hypothetical protein [Chromobacterium phragmitis]|uniref:Uncharacterized protein n=2 Tax=Chromobacterium phragmitis TaxID=2202141 RepID=A0ABV0IYR1_9NEIS